MGRPNYMTVSVADTIQDMFNEFVSIKNITKTAALNDVIEMYMLAKDEELYLELKKKYLKVESVRDMIADRDSDGEENINDFLFMKLGISYTVDGEKIDGEDTMKLYITNEKKNGYAWFSTQSLYNGMKKERVRHYNKLIQNGKNVKILFALNNENIRNDIGFSADVLEICSDKLPIGAPDDAYPPEFEDEKAKIWIKLINIERETKINASMLKITSTGKDLKQTITNSQYHFGYVTYK